MFEHFKKEEFACSETGENEIRHSFVLALDELRTACGFPFVINSGYRSPNHSIEAAKDQPGTHTEGIAADIKVNNGSERYILVKNAFELGFGGVGIAKSFVHVDVREGTQVCWVY